MSQPDGTLIHPEEVDSGIVASVVIAVSIVIVLILGTVRSRSIYIILAQSFYKKKIIFR